MPSAAAPRPSTVGLWGRHGSVVLIALVAVVYNSVADIGVLALPPRVEAVLQTILAFLG